MNWLQEIEPDLFTVDRGIVDFQIKRINNIEKIQKKYSILTEFYISLAAKKEELLF